MSSSAQPAAFDLALLLTRHMSANGPPPYKEASSMFQAAVLARALSNTGAHVEVTRREWVLGQRAGQSQAVYALMVGDVPMGPLGEISWFEVARTQLSKELLQHSGKFSSGMWLDVEVLPDVIETYTEPSSSLNRDLLHAAGVAQAWLQSRMLAQPSSTLAAPARAGPRL